MGPRISRLSIDAEPRAMTTVPVRTSSLTPYVRRSATSASTSDSDPVASTMIGGLGDVDDAGLVQLDDPDDLAAVRVGRPDLDQGQLVLDRRLAGQVLDLEHVDQPVELLDRLLDEHVVAVEGDRHPADVGLVGVADGERLDVEVARPHQARHAVQDAGLVEDEDDQDVAVGDRRSRAAPGPAASRGPGVGPVLAP